MTERPAFVATAAGADEALARVRRRRRRAGALAGGGGAALSVVAVAAVLALQPSPDDTLRVDDEPVAPIASATANIDPTAPISAEPTPEPTTSPAPPASATSTSGAAPGASPSAVAPAPTPASSGGVPAPQPATPAPTARRGTTLSRDVVGYSATTECAVSTGQPGWCVRWNGPSGSASGARAVLSMQLCNLPDGRGGRVDFDDAREIDVRIYQGAQTDPPAWGWYDDRLNARGPTVDVADGTCLRWRLDWDGLGLDGQPLERGEYTLGYGVSGQYGDVRGSWTSYAGSYTVY